MLVDSSPNDLLARISRSLCELRLVKHLIHLLLVACLAFVGTQVTPWSTIDLLLRLLLVILSLHSGQMLMLLHAVKGGCHLVLLVLGVKRAWHHDLRMVACLVRGSVAHPIGVRLVMVIERVTLALHHALLLLMAIGIGPLPVAIDLMTNDSIKRLSMHAHHTTVAIPLPMRNRHRVIRLCGMFPTYS